MTNFCSTKPQETYRGKCIRRYEFAKKVIMEIESKKYPKVRIKLNPYYTCDIDKDGNIEFHFTMKK